MSQYGLLIEKLIEKPTEQMFCGLFVGEKEQKKTEQKKINF
jgi:hypothetical protein